MQTYRLPGSGKYSSVRVIYYIFDFNFVSLTKYWI